jgi:hypothetical protein
VLPYNFNIREGHTTQSAAEDRVYRQAGVKIEEEYAGLLRGHRE